MNIELYKLTPDKLLWLLPQVSKSTLPPSHPYFTDYCLVHQLSKQEILFINTLSGATDYIKGASPSQFAFILSGRAKHPQTAKMRKYFYRRGYLFADKRDEQNMRKNVSEAYPLHRLPYSYIIILTTLCNFSCYYCNQKNIVKVKKTMGDEELARCLNFIKHHSAKHKSDFANAVVNLYGGEPLLPDLKGKIHSIFKAAKQNQWMINITTNGYTLLDLIPLFSQFKSQLGFILVTIDGPEKVHNSRRKLKFSGNKHTFRKIVRGIEKVISIGIHCAININIDKFNIKDLDNLYRYIRRKKWHRNDLINFDTSYVSDYDRVQKYMLAEKQRQSLPAKTMLFKSLKIGHYTSKHQQYLERLLQLSHLGKITKFVPPLTRGCFPRQMLVFHVDGQIYPCPTLACAGQFPIGQFISRPKIYTKTKEKFEKISVSHLKECRNCIMAFLCGGPCPARYCMRDRSINKSLCIGQNEAEHDILRFFKDNELLLRRKLVRLHKPDLVLKNISSDQIVSK